MLRNKHMRLNQEKIEKIKEILKVRTETEAVDMALDRVIQAEAERSKKRTVRKHIVQLRDSLGRIPEDSTEWVRLARRERVRSNDSRA